MDFEKKIRDLENQIEKLKKYGLEHKEDMSVQIKPLEIKLDQLKRDTYSNLGPWQIVQLMRHPDRPRALDYAEGMLTDFVEVHGDRQMADDKAMICGFGKLDGQPLALVATQKGRDTKENLLRNFGMAQPDGYRKALRFMRLAERFKLPIVTLIDTAGAYPGLEGEERSVAEAIARNLYEMSRFSVPIVVVIIGEGGSGGALGIGVGDRVLMLENAYYSVISPEGCAAILWRDRGKAEEAAEALKGTAKELQELGIIDEIVAEPLGGAHQDPPQAVASLKAAIKKHLDDLLKKDEAERIETRYQKFRAMGVWEDVKA